MEVEEEKIVESIGLDGPFGNLGYDEGVPILDSILVVAVVLVGVVIHDNTIVDESHNDKNPKTKILRENVVDVDSDGRVLLLLAALHAIS